MDADGDDDYLGGGLCWRMSWRIIWLGRITRSIVTIREFSCFGFCMRLGLTASQGVVHPAVLPQDDGQGGSMDECGEHGFRAPFCCHCAGWECWQVSDGGGTTAI